MKTPFEGLIISLFRSGIFQNVNQHRARAAGTGNGKCFPDNICQIFGSLDNIVRFGDRHGDAGDINFLKRVLPDEAFSNIYFFRNAMKNLHGWFTDSQLVLIDKTSTYAYNTNGR